MRTVEINKTLRIDFLYPGEYETHVSKVIKDKMILMFGWATGFSWGAGGHMANRRAAYSSQ